MSMPKLLLSVFFLSLTGSAHAAAFSDLPADSRIRLVAYDANDIYTVATRPGYQTNIEFARGEEIQTISVGERSNWQIIPNANRLFIRPMDTNIATNMTVITSRHSYQFDLKSISGKKAAISYVLRFTYPEDAPKHATPIALPPAPPTRDTVPPAPVALSREPAAPPAFVPHGKRNYLYTFSGPENAAPFEVFDDGNATYLRYQDENRPAPKASKFTDGTETDLAVRRDGDYYVIDAVVPELLLREGGAAVHVYNEALTVKP